MPASDHFGPVIPMGAPQAALHRFRPLVWRTHAAECSHGDIVTANVERDHRDTQRQLRSAGGEQ